MSKITTTYGGVAPPPVLSFDDLGIGDLNRVGGVLLMDDQHLALPDFIVNLEWWPAEEGKQ